MTTNRKTLFAAVLAGIGASACCIGPLLLLTLGVSGTWIGSLTAMEPYSPYLSGLTVLILIYVFRKLYFVPQKCEEGSICENKSVLNRQRIIFWIVAVVLLAMIAFPYYAEYIIS
jgi:mercuric ion transport protein